MRKGQGEEGLWAIPRKQKTAPQLYLAAERLMSLPFPLKGLDLVYFMTNVMVLRCCTGRASRPESCWC